MNEYLEAKIPRWEYREEKEATVGRSAWFMFFLSSQQPRMTLIRILYPRRPRRVSNCSSGSISAIRNFRSRRGHYGHYLTAEVL